MTTISTSASLVRFGWFHRSSNTAKTTASQNQPVAIPNADVSNDAVLSLYDKVIMREPFTSEDVTALSTLTPEVDALFKEMHSSGRSSRGTDSNREINRYLKAISVLRQVPDFFSKRNNAPDRQALNVSHSTVRDGILIALNQVKIHRGINK